MTPRPDSADVFVKLYTHEAAVQAKAQLEAKHKSDPDFRQKVEIVGSTFRLGTATTFADLHNRSAGV